MLRLPSGELRDALTTLELQLERMRREPEPRLSDLQELALRRISGAARRLAQLTEKALIGALEAQALARPRLASVDVGALALEVVESLQPDAEARSVTLAYEASASLPHLASDAELLRHCLHALVVHTIRSSRGGAVKLALALEEGAWRASVTASEARAQEDSVDLQLAGRIATVLGGRIEPAEAGAHEYVLTLPLAQARPVATPKPRVEPHVAAPLILIVEDDREIREELAELLRDEGYDVDAVSGATEARRHANRYGVPPDLILLDLTMAGGDGRQFREAQLKDPRLASIPVVLLSGAGDVKQTAEDLGTTAYVAKPFRLEALLDMIERLCPRTRKQDGAA